MLHQVTYTDDGSGFKAEVTYDGAIGPPAIPLPAIPFQEDQIESQPLPEPIPQDLDVIIAKGQGGDIAKVDELEEGDKSPPVHLTAASPQLPGLPHVHQAHQLHHQAANHHHLHLDHNQLYALHLLHPRQASVFSPRSFSAGTRASLFDTEPAAILARGDNLQLPQKGSKQKEVRQLNNHPRHQPLPLASLDPEQSNTIDLSQFTLLGVGRVLG